ncbi:MAG: Ig-like domain-containing protein [Tepidanaerobacteraceae bacterium]|nr:Ig-like domain-containing protein [Tepidanaerobacteraceae bacterium]
MGRIKKIAASILIPVLVFASFSLKINTARADAVILLSTYPAQNQQGVEIEPVIKFNFSSPVEILDKSKISINFGEETYPLDHDKDIYLSNDGKTLNIEINDEPYPLRRNTPYTVVLEAGCVIGSNGITNEKTELNFVTAGDGQRPAVSGYSSSPSGGDDITSLSGTRLSGGGTIYIRFDRNIKWDKDKEDMNLQDAVKLYKIPKALETALDPSGSSYDSVVEYVYGQGVPGADPDESQRVPVGSISIVNNNTLAVKPESSLLSLNRYKLFIDRDIVEDTYGYNPEKDIEFYFWTASSGTLSANWAGVSSSRTYGAPAYDSTTPIVLYADGEVILKAGDDSALGRIVLSEGYNSNAVAEIEKVRLEYYYENSVKKTKIKIYPKAKLDWGKYYKLSISGDVFETRSGRFLSALAIEFVVRDKSGESRGICGIYPSSMSVLDIMGGSAAFTVTGYNFNESVEKVELLPVAGNAAGGDAVAVEKADIEFVNVTELLIKLRSSDAVKKLSQDSGSGTYIIKIYFSDRAEPVENSSVSLAITPRGKPEVKEKYPSEDGWVNEKNLNPKVIDGTTRYFLKITFDDSDGSLALNESGGLDLIKSSYVHAGGENATSMIDAEFVGYIQNMQDTAQKKSYIEKYIFVKDSGQKKAYLFIPVKQLRSQTTYAVTVNAGIVYCTDSSGNLLSGNDVIEWSFTTAAVPSVTGVVTGSVPENYDEDVPIILQGDYFDGDNVEVYFNDIRADRVKVDTDEGGNTILKVYLPSGSRRLDPGLYAIRVANDDDHEYEIYGALSVVKEGDFVPNEEYMEKSNSKAGEVRGNVKLSSDTLLLDSDFTDKSRVSLDLDELMGEDVLVRKISFKGSAKKEIGMLETYSKWADVTLYRLTLDSTAESRDIEIILGRAEPVMAAKLKSSLAAGKAKSDFIRVAGENFKVSGIKVVVPFAESNGEHLKALRYDEKLRSWEEEYSAVDRIDRRVTITSSGTGIFVVVEEGGK